MALHDRSTEIVIGRIATDALATLPRLQILADYLAQNLAPQGILLGRVVVAESNEQMRELLKRGEVDILSETTMSALWLEENAGVTPLLREWKDGVASHHVVFISRRDSGINSIDDLRGKVVAFESPGSTTGFLAPLAMLNGAGLASREIPLRVRPAVDEVGYIFANSALNVAAMVERGLVDAGTMSNLDWLGFASNQGLVAKLRVFQDGIPLPRSLLLAAPGLRPELRDAIRSVLTDVHKHEADIAALRRYYRVNRYDVLSGSAPDLAIARELYPLVRDAM